MEDKIELLRAKGKVRNGADGLFYVGVGFRDEDSVTPYLGGLSGLGALAPFSDEEVKNTIMKWAEYNCVGQMDFHGLNTLKFTEQEDAVLLWLTLKR